MTRTMGDLEKMRPRASVRDFFRASRKKWPSTRKSDQKPIAFAQAAVKDHGPLRGAPLVPRSASLTAPSLRLPSFHGELALPGAPPLTEPAHVRYMVTKIIGRKVRLNLIERLATGYNI